MFEIRKLINETTDLAILKSIVRRNKKAGKNVQRK